MDFKKLSVPVLLAIVIIAVVVSKCFSQSNPSTAGVVSAPIIDEPVKAMATAVPGSSLELTADDTAIRQQLDRDRQQQRQTKYLKTQLEQTNLELEQEKALAEINKLKMENFGSLEPTTLDGQKIPDVKVEYIGGDDIKKEAILSIGGTSFQVKEKSSPADNIQVVSISDSDVTLHFSAPQEVTKTIDFKPE